MIESWLENNNNYLEASLHWLRLRLQRLAAQERRPQPSHESDRDGPHTSAASRFSRWIGRGTSPATQVPLLCAGNPPSLDEQIEAAAGRREVAAAMDPAPALLLLAERFGLSSFERDTLFLCAALEFDPGLSLLYSLAQSSQHDHPTFSLALSLFDDPSWDVLSAHRPLRYARLIEINQPGAMPLTSSPLRADERVTNYLKGLNVLDDRLSTLLDSDDVTQTPLAPSQQAVADMILQRLQNSSSEATLPIVQLVGADAGSRVAVARQVCAAVNRRLYRIAIESLPTQMAESETLARLWQRESLLLPLALYIDVNNADSISPEISSALHRFLGHEIGVVFLGVRETPVRLGAANFSADVNKPTAAEQCRAWSDILGEFQANPETAQTAAMLAGQFNFSLSDIHAAALIAIKAPSEDKPLSQAIWESCCDLTRPRLDSMAQRLDPKATWKDLVLPNEQMSLMRHIAGQVRERYKVYDQWGFARTMNRGFGISALFAGESGTGKTMAAEVLANDLRLNLYRIDLSAVVSKYIGETEKNLRKLFDAAERGGAILFFDEADALFGKRSEVKDSHDRYANIEINYLLQRMEAFSGLAILATNMKSALDAAFMRRLRFIVNLPFPGVKERQVIWQKALPPETPTRDLDYERLARLNLSGGNIHSIALSAAFMAAQNGQTVTMPILLAAARGELRKLEKGFSESELR
ncbi:MAG TPA: ATP-binding protein [Pyrinomonadaceae bacterium]|nr:ATP-binding protein [Pyrinomonadaceae bacterium]